MLHVEELGAVAQLSVSAFSNGKSSTECYATVRIDLINLMPIDGIGHSMRPCTTDPCKTTCSTVLFLMLPVTLQAAKASPSTTQQPHHIHSSVLGWSAGKSHFNPSCCASFPHASYTNHPVRMSLNCKWSLFFFPHLKHDNTTACALLLNTHCLIIWCEDSRVALK